MKLLHTSDWHLGQQLHHFSRESEHARFLSWLLDALETHAIDVLLLTGDVFDSANPPASAQSAYYDFLARCQQRLPWLQIIVLAGNHDSALRLDAPAELLRALNIEVVGALRPIDKSVIALKDRTGRACAQLVAVPFLKAQDFEFDSRDAVAATRLIYAERIEEAKRRAQPNQALLASGHCYMVGGELSELSERAIQRGNQDALPVDLFPAELAYVALGHLHRAQRVGGRDGVRYAGSPIPLSLIEREYIHQVVVVEFDGAKAPRIDSLIIPRTREIWLIPEEHAPFDAVLEALRALPRGAPSNEPTALLEVRILLDQAQARIRPRILEALSGVAAELLKVSVRYPPALDQGEQTAARSDEALTPLGLLEQQWRMQFSSELPEALRNRFLQAQQIAAQA